MKSVEACVVADGRTDEAEVKKVTKVSRTKKQDPMKMSEEELFAKLTTDAGFASEFLANFAKIQKAVAAFKKANRVQAATAKAKAKAEKETHERSKLMETDRCSAGGRTLRQSVP